MATMQLPHNLEAEQMVLGTLLVFPDSWPKIAGTVSADDFYPERHRLIFAGISELQRTGCPIDFVSLSGLLKTQGNLETSGGAGYLVELTDPVVTSETTGWYARKVKDLSLQRVMYRALTDTARVVCDENADISEALSEGYRILTDAANQRQRGGGSVYNLAEMAERYTAHVSELGKNRFVTGFDPLDAVIKGVAPGEVLTITAYSGLGKSAFLHNILLDGCKRTGLHHMFFSLEMPLTRVFERTVQIALGRLTYNVESEFHHHATEKRATTMAELAGVNANKLLVCEEGGLNLEKIELYTEQARATLVILIIGALVFVRPPVVSPQLRRRTL